MAVGLSPSFFKISFVAGINSFNWARRDDIDTCHTNKVFYGPIQLVVTGAFTVVELENIKKEFALFSKAIVDVFVELENAGVSSFANRPFPGCLF